jgi:5-methylcytosine-specific restriction endonuclease McrA
MSSDVPSNPRDFRAQLATLRRNRKRRKREGSRRSRRGLNGRDRELVLSKTNGRCHVCGGAIEGGWQADHVLAHSGGGQCERDNYLASHPVCNNYRWDYLPEEFQIILKLGVWARTQIERGTFLGEQMAARFVTYEAKRAYRRKTGGKRGPSNKSMQTGRAAPGG